MIINLRLFLILIRTLPYNYTTPRENKNQFYKVHYVNNFVGKGYKVNGEKLSLYTLEELIGNGNFCKYK